ncbi:hypothetical protein VNO78_05799 [Psophocarpus tetragonolobus]|uniref:Uncharacterized protein n=1 Tax=Psophocarpus tetragonolobus TaxID=3891 RepID=A0AAN9SRE8_PSOTE
MASSCRGYSKAQICFFKILRIISSTPRARARASKGVGIDLNMRLFSSGTESESCMSEEEGAEEEGFPEKEKSMEEEHKNNKVNNEVETGSFQGGHGNCLDLLIEAARVISGREEESGREKRKERWVVVDLYGDVFEERQPVVRSKRGRNQALPYRFRDSVLEPLKRSTRTHSHNLVTRTTL